MRKPTFWLLWVVATAVAFAAAMVVEFIAAYAVGLPLTLLTLPLDAGWVFNTVRFGAAGVCGGAAFGVIQWFAVRRIGPQIRSWVLLWAFACGCRRPGWSLGSGQPVLNRDNGLRQ